MGLDENEKALIMASAVLGTILLTLVIFAALYKSFIAEYSSTYNRQMMLLRGTLNPAVVNPAADQLDEEPIVPASPKSKESTAAPVTALTMPPADPSPVEDRVKVTIADPSSNTTWGNTAPSSSNKSAWAGDEDAGNDFFSADEQARIWAELREAEEKAASGVPSAADKAASVAREVSEEAALEADADTKFGFADDESKEMQYITPGEAVEKKDATLRADYVNPETLVATGEVFDAKVGGNVKVNDAEWWK